MRIRGLAVAVILVGCVVGGTRAAHADPKGDVQAKIKEGMESYDLLDYDAARKALNQAIAIAKKAKLDKDPLVARAYLDIGIVAFAVPDQEGAKVSFLSAVQIDPASDYAHFALALACERTGERDRARGHLKLAIAMRPGIVDYERALARLG